PLTGSLVRFPTVERVDKLRQRVAPIRPRRVILRQQQAGCVRCELPERDLADVAALLQLDSVLATGSSSPSSPLRTACASSVASNTFRNEARLNSGRRAVRTA